MTGPPPDSSGGLAHPERVLMKALTERLSGESGRRLRVQLEHVGRVERPRTLPEVTFWTPEEGGRGWSGEVLFPRRHEFVLATVDLRVERDLHRCEVVAVNGRVFAVMASPPIPYGSQRVQVEAVRLGLDPMSPGRPALAQPAGPGARSSQPVGWTLLSGSPGDPKPSPAAVEMPILAVGPRGALLVGRRDPTAVRYRLVEAGGVPVTLRARRLDEALREATAVLGS